LTWKFLEPLLLVFATLRLYIIKKIPGAVSPGFATLRPYINMKNKKSGFAARSLYALF